MLLWSFQITLISVILIFLIHYLINFFKSTLTVPKIKDLVNSPIQKYKNMYNVIDNNFDNKYENKYENKNDKNDKNEYNLKSQEDNLSMKNELKNFLKKQLNTPTTTTEVSTFDSMSNVNSYLQL
jgi:ABC-type multidrug transport system fused ATPase/permease subunit